MCCDDDGGSNEDDEVMFTMDEVNLSSCENVRGECPALATLELVEVMALKRFG